MELELRSGESLRESEAIAVSAAAAAARHCDSRDAKVATSDAVRIPSTQSRATCWAPASSIARAAWLSMSTHISRRLRVRQPRPDSVQSSGRRSRRVTAPDVTRSISVHRFMGMRRTPVRH